MLDKIITTLMAVLVVILVAEWEKLRNRLKFIFVFCIAALFVCDLKLGAKIFDTTILILVGSLVSVLVLKWKKLRNSLKFIIIFCLAMLYVCDLKHDEKTDDSALLWYDSPAKIWEATLPLGNGRIGMMPDGGIENENIVLNDITMWSGSEADYSNPEAVKSLPEIRKLLLEGKNFDAQQLMYKTFTCGNKGTNYGAGADATFGCYQTLGNLEIKYYYRNTSHDYRRGLDLETATAFTEFTNDDVKFKREYFVSRKGDVAIIHLTADKKNEINFTAKLNREKDSSLLEFKTEDDAIVMCGQLNDGVNGGNGVKYLSKLSVKNKGGNIEYADNQIVVTNATDVMLIFSSATNFKNDDYVSLVNEKMENAKFSSYKKLYKEHLKSYKEFYNRVELNLGEPMKLALTTEEQLADYQFEEDPSFAALYFNFGRYLFISSTREGLLPPNLQGLWANTIQTPWNGDYHLNINLQMNHWLTEVCNLPELENPLIEYTKGLVKSGEETAETFYGADGWVAHWASNPWHFTTPGEDPSWGSTNTCGAWLCQHLYNHYLYTQDVDYLKDIYPVLKGSAEFFHSIMIEEPTHNWLVTAPTSSPENAFIDNEGRWTYVCMGSTMDIQIVAELFQNVISANEILAENSIQPDDNEFVETLKSDLLRFPPMQISKDGYLQEWLEDYKETDIHHRHVSHLFGLYPASLITQTKTPELFEACKVTLNRRGDEGTGWSRAWKINFWARLHDGERANKLITSLLSPAVTGDGTKVKAGTYPNLFCAHPPFQIDGNLGGTAGIAEMLLQSHDGFIELLPTAPSSWKSGCYKGLCAVGGAIVDCYWKDGKVTKAKVYSKCGGIYKIKNPNTGEIMEITLKAGKSKNIKLNE